MQSRNFRWAIIFLIAALYIFAWFQDGSMMFIDLPNHTARAYAIGHLNFDPTLQERFIFIPCFTSYIGGDLFYAALLLIFPVTLGSKIFVTICFLSLPAGLAYLLRSLRAPREQSEIIILLSLFLSANWFLLSAYLNYCLGLGISLVSVAWALRLTKEPATPLRWAAYIASVAVVFTVHLATFIIAGGIIAAIISIRLLTDQRKNSGETKLFRRIPPAALLRAAAIVSPFGALFLYHEYEQHFLLSPRGMAFVEIWDYRTPLSKLTSLFAIFARFNYLIDGLLLLIFSTAWLVLAADWYKRRRKSSPGEITPGLPLPELIAAIACCVLIYLALPYSTGPHTEVDQRALPYFAALLLLLILGAGSPAALKIGFQLAAIANLLNAAYLFHYISLDNEFIRDYAVVRSMLPEKIRVLPVAARPERGRVATTISLAALYMTEKNGVSPYIACQTKTPRALRYFDYRTPPFALSPFWYLRDEDKNIKWDHWLQRFEYVIVSKPYDPGRIPLSRLELEYSNSAADLFKISK